MTDTDPDTLIAHSMRAAARAHAPYSEFQVGCAIESSGGEIAVGANMENACYRLGVCAEQSALTAAQQMFGLDHIRRIAVCGGPTAPAMATEMVITPCGGCRQAILEAAQLSGRDIEIICANRDGSVSETHRISALLPHAFDAGSLQDG
ncbi:MAG: cytidine deaminase [Pacificimonas sp.]